MSYVCTALWVAREGEADRVRGLLRDLVEASRDEPGTFRLFEAYADEDAFRAHAASDHFRRLVLDGAVPLLSHRERAFGTTIEP